ncbi:MAG TPA: terminase small subunit [Anaerolineae bacterium]|nr:terminase small subunit [Anaerolineae bacterium]
MAYSRLTPQRKMFCREYLRLRNATKAYIAAGYSPTGADRGASRLLKKPVIQEYIEELLRSVHLGKDQVVSMLHEIATGEWTQYIVATEDGSPSLDWQRVIYDGKGYMLRGFKPTAQGIEWKLCDSQELLVKIAEAQGVLETKGDRSEQAANAAFVDLANQMLRRIKEAEDGS